MWTEKQKTWGAMGLLILLHAVGFISWHTSWASWVSLLTPIHLLISFWLLVWFAGGGQTLKFRLLLVYLLGLGVEILGVHTGYPFGTYVYLEGLGPAIWDTPWMIGVNWAMLSLAGGQWVYSYVSELPRWQRHLIAATLLVLLDFLFEPVAPSLRLWLFAGTAGWMNYLGWFVTAWGMQA
ncbi:MAG: carotenoid biosynthesis protein, partial [Schleiferiaceae bacterium]